LEFVVLRLSANYMSFFPFPDVFRSPSPQAAVRRPEHGRERFGLPAQV